MKHRSAKEGQATEKKVKQLKVEAYSNKKRNKEKIGHHMTFMWYKSPSHMIKHGTSTVL
jgi:hypothetical protein